MDRKMKGHASGEPSHSPRLPPRAVSGLMQWQIKFRLPILSRFAQFEIIGLSLDGTRPYNLNYPVTKWDS